METGSNRPSLFRRFRLEAIGPGPRRFLRLQPTFAPFDAFGEEGPWLTYVRHWLQPTFALSTLSASSSSSARSVAASLQPTFALSTLSATRRRVRGSSSCRSNRPSLFRRFRLADGPHAGTVGYMLQPTFALSTLSAGGGGTLGVVSWRRLQPTFALSTLSAQLLDEIHGAVLGAPTDLRSFDPFGKFLRRPSAQQRPAPTDLRSLDTFGNIRLLYSSARPYSAPTDLRSLDTFGPSSGERAAGVLLVAPTDLRSLDTFCEMSPEYTLLEDPPLQPTFALSTLSAREMIPGWSTRHAAPTDLLFRRFRPRSSAALAMRTVAPTDLRSFDAFG